MPSASKVLFMKELIPFGRAKAKSTREIHDAIENNFVGGRTGVRRTTLRHLWELASSAYEDVAVSKVGASYVWFRPDRANGEY